MAKKSKKETPAPEIYTAQREGTTADGGTFRCFVAVGGMKVNGKDVSNEMASEMVATFLTGVSAEKNA